MASDLISRAAAIEHMKSMAGCDACNNYAGVRCRACPWDDAMDIVDELPAVDAAPVVHARWIEYPLCLGYVGAYSEEHIVCSNCKSVWNIIDNDTERFKHCPNCGAKMDGGEA